MHFIDYLETEVNWNKVFGVVNSVYTDKGFKSNADNFIRSIAVEKAFSKFANVRRVDKNGYDFEYVHESIEMKMGKNLFYKKDPFTTKKFKVKSFLSAKKTIEDHQQESTYDYLMVIDLTAQRVVVVEDHIARPLYEAGSDGAMIQLSKGTYYECEIGEVNAIEPAYTLSELIESAYDKFLDF